MDEVLFSELTRSVKEAGEIKRGKRRPSRVHQIDALDVEAIRRMKIVCRGHVFAGKFARP